jgi:iron complex outermembrane receptor protein
MGLSVNMILAQNKIQVKVVSKETKETIFGASVLLKSTSNGNTTDFNGLATLKNIPNGQQTLVISYLGFQIEEETLFFPLNNTAIFLVLLQEEEETLDAILIQATRSKRTIAKTPTRIEVVGLDELGEKALMNSTNIAMILRESTGIQMQQTSANSANQSIRIQGLDGRFTQLLKDGFPLFGGFSSGLSIMQIPPLDLKQVEIIKGSSSTLYGGGAIAGLVNLVSKIPKEEKELKIMFDITSRNGNTLNAFYSKRKHLFGITLYTSGNLQNAIDVNADHFSDIPKVRSFSINPSLFYYPNKKETWRLSINANIENRIGGDLHAINGNTSENHFFSEENSSNRYATQLTYENAISDTQSFNFKSSISSFKRDLILPNYAFLGRQIATFTEGTYTSFTDNASWIFGGNIITEKFTETPTTALDRSYYKNVFGGFVQNSLDIKENITLESGLRTDFTTNYGSFILPRASLLIEFNTAISSRIGAGLGYKIPTIFTEDAELRSYQNVLPIKTTNFKAETSLGINADVNYNTKILNGQIVLSFNQLFFLTKLKNSLILEQRQQNYAFVNADKTLHSIGFETNLKLKYKDFVLFTNYAFNDVKLEQNQKALTPKHSFGGVLMYEVENNWRIGYEAYYKGSQLRNNLTKTPDFWTMGFMVMKTIAKVSIYVNFENFTDTKQQNYQSMTEESHNNPRFTDIWAPTDGFVLNTGVLIKL